ncbi:MAG: hypothetical protein J6K28_02910 [Alistipes sp.]|nr:hypothetical protein [Alistipes sp.]
MKRILFLSAVALLCGLSDSQAKKPEDQEFNRVVVTLTSGEKVEGYVKRGWHAESSHFKRPNYSFKLTPAPDGKDAVKYTADSVASVEYTEPRENHPDGLRWEVWNLALPSIADRYHTERRFVCVDSKCENSTIYWWKYWDQTYNGQRTIVKLVTAYGIRFNGEDIVYNFNLLLPAMFKTTHPGLGEMYKSYFKGKEGKARKKELKDDVTVMARPYDEWLKTKK